MTPGEHSCLYTVMKENDGIPSLLTDELLNTGELAQRLGCTERHIFNLIRRGQLPHIRVGRLVRFNWPTVLRVLEERGTLT